MRLSGRNPIDLRTIKIIPDFVKHPEGSVLFGIGQTQVLCCASVVDGVPSFLENTQQGWITGEYSMLPRATHTRKIREVTIGKPTGRTQEIQRLIGRSLRAVCDRKKIPRKTIYLDCDVLQADGGTRTAAITGAYIALALACQRLVNQGQIEGNPLLDQVAAVSVGMQNGTCFLDLDYEEDSNCDVDMNVVMTGDGRFVEVQGTAEKAPFSFEEQQSMLQTAQEGIQQLLYYQRETIENAK